MNILNLAVLAVSVLVFPTSGLAADLAPKFIDAHAVFETSLAGDKNATQPAIEKFSMLVEQNPAQPLYRVYLGSTYALRARDAWMPWTKLRNVEKGLEMIDKALLMLTPEHDEQRLRGSIVSTETRLVAVSTFLRVPGFMNRRQPAKDLLRETLDTPVFDASPALVKGRLYLGAANIARREDQKVAERDYLEKALSLLPPSRFRSQAEQQLIEIEEPVVEQ